MSQKLFTPLALVVGLVVGSAMLAPSEARAQGPGGYGYGYGAWPGVAMGGVTGFGVGGSLYGLGQIPVPPYFSLHPPVYYSQPVARTYGYSPFPYSGNRLTPEVVMQPEEVLNPHVTPKVEAPQSETSADEPSVKTASHRRPAPLWISNPYYQPHKSDASLRVAAKH